MACQVKTSYNPHLWIINSHPYLEAAGRSYCSVTSSKKRKMISSDQFVIFLFLHTFVTIGVALFLFFLAMTET